MITKIIILLFAFTSAYAIVDIVPLSPYINRGMSVDAHLSYNPFMITHHYEQKPQKYKFTYVGEYGWFVDEYYYGYSAYSNIIQFIKNDWERWEGFINIGFPKEKLEISAWVKFFCSMDNIKARVKYNHVEKGENRLFKNIAISPFAGWTFKYYNMDKFSEIIIHDHSQISRPEISIIILYSGVSLGTRKKIYEFSYFEIFTNPHFAFTQYKGLGNRSYDPAKILSNNSVDENSTIKLRLPDFSMPIGIGLKYKKIALKTGIAITATIGGETRDLDRDGTFLDKIVVDSHNFPNIPFFAEMSFHFGKLGTAQKQP